MGSRNRASARELGSRLQAYRDNAGLTLRDLAEKVGRSPRTFEPVGNGVPGAASESEVVYYLASCGASYEDVERLLQFCRDANDDRGYWLCPSGEWMSDSLRSLVFHESSANQAVNYQPEVIPGLLQTEPYIQALLSRENISTERRQARVQDRLQRQRILWRNRPAEFTFVINERALRLEVGDYRVMAEQLLAMLFFSDQRNITIRLVPSVARHHALFGGSFVYLGHERFSPLVYIEGALGGFFVEDAGYVAGYRSLLTDIAKVALDAEQSRLLIADLADQYDRAEGTWDDAWQVAQKQL